MSSSDGDARSGSGSDAEKRKSKEEDWAWKHCTPFPGTKSKVKCNYCGKALLGGGITRFKYHIVGGDKNVAKCKSVSESVRKDFKAAMTAKKEKKVAQEKADQLYFDTMFNVTSNTRRGGGSSEESDDDIAYPAQYADSQYMRRMWRRIRKDSIRAEWEREQVAEQMRRGAGGSGFGSQIPMPVPVPVIDLEDQAHGKRKKGRIDEMFRRSASMRLSVDPDEPGVRKPEKSRQPKIKQMFSGLSNTKEKVGKAISKFFFAHGIPAHVATEPYLQHMVDAIGGPGKSIKAPTAWEIMNKYLPQEKEEITMWINKQKGRFAEYGVTLMCDGWTSGNRKQIINFLAYCNGATIYLGSVDASGEVRSSRYVEKLMIKYMHEVGVENIVQIVTDNGSNFKKAGNNVMGKYPVYWTPCAAHCIDLMLKDIGKIAHVKQVVTNARLITAFIYNRSFLLAAMRRPEYCDGDLVRPGITRFATNFLALKSLKSKKDGLKRLFSGPEWSSMRKERESDVGQKIESLLHNRDFWDNITRLLKIMEPIVRVLRLVDGDKKSTLCWLYDAVEKMKEEVAQVAPRSKEQYLKIIDKRWNKMLLHPLHRAAHYFNPRFQYKYNLGLQPEFLVAVREVVERLVTSSAQRVAIMDELRQFREGSGYFGHPNAVQDRDHADPCEWWIWHGIGTPELLRIALRVLSQTASAGGCERNWSTFNLIHSKRRNKLGAERLSNLVFVHYNMRLRARNIKDDQFKEVELSAIHDPIDTSYTFGAPEDDKRNPMQAWMNEIGGAPLLDDVHGAPDPEIERTFEPPREADIEEQQRDKTPPGRLEPDPEHDAVDMEIENEIQKSLSASSSSRSATSRSSTSKSKSDESKSDGGGDDDGTGGDGLNEYRETYEAEDRPYVLDVGARAERYTATEDPQHKIYGRRKTRGNKEYSGAPQPQDDQTDIYSDLADSMGSMSMHDSDSHSHSSFVDQLFGHPQSSHGGSHHGDTRPHSAHSGYEPYGHGSVPVQTESAAPATGDVYSYGFLGGFQTPYGPYSYSSSYSTTDGGQTWFGGASMMIPVPQLQPLPAAPQHVAPSTSSTPSRKAPTIVEFEQAKALEEFFPKFGMMEFVNPAVYKEHVETYNKGYRNYMTWAQYVNHINRIMYGEGEAKEGNQQARHSTYN